MMMMTRLSVNKKYIKVVKRIQSSSSLSLSLSNHADESDDESDSYAAASPPPKACLEMASICVAEAEWRLRGGPRRSKSVLAVTPAPIPLATPAVVELLPLPLPLLLPLSVLSSASMTLPSRSISSLDVVLLGVAHAVEIRSNIGREPLRALGSRDATAVDAEMFEFPIAAAVAEALGDRREVALPVPLLVAASRLADPHPLSLLRVFAEASLSLDTALPRFRPAREKRFLLDRPTVVVAGPSSLGGVIIVAILDWKQSKDDMSASIVGHGINGF